MPYALLSRFSILLYRQPSVEKDRLRSNRFQHGSNRFQHVASLFRAPRRRRFPIARTRLGQWPVSRRPVVGIKPLETGARPLPRQGRQKAVGSGARRKRRKESNVLRSLGLERSEMVPRWDSAVARWDSAVARWGSAVARWGSAVARWGSAVARWGSAVARRRSAVARWRSAVARWGSAVARWDSAVARWQSAVARWIVEGARSRSAVARRRGSFDRRGRLCSSRFRERR